RRPFRPQWRTQMQNMLGAIALFAAIGASTGTLAQEAPRPTIVFVHGAFADASGWGGVITRLNQDGYRTVAAANPLRSVAGDAAARGAAHDHCRRGGPGLPFLWRAGHHRRG